MAVNVVGRSRVSRDVLALLVSTPGQELHTREIARRVKADAHPVQRALEQLLGQGLVDSRRLGNLRLWSLAVRNPLIPSLREVLRRTTGPAARLRERLTEMSGVQLAFLFGSYAAGRDKLGSDVDLFVIGSPDWRRLSKELASLSDEIGREINPVVWSVDDLRSPTSAQAHFLRRLVRDPKIWLVGDDHELERTRSSVGAKVGPGPSGPAGRPRRTRRPKAAGAR